MYIHELILINHSVKLLIGHIKLLFLNFNQKSLKLVNQKCMLRVSLK